MQARFTPVALWPLCLGLLLGCSGDSESTASADTAPSSAYPGQEGGECVGGDLCDWGLVCEGGVCVSGERDPLGGGPVGAGGGGGSTAGSANVAGGGATPAGGSGGSAAAVAGGTAGALPLGGAPGTGGRPGGPPPFGGSGGTASGGSGGSAVAGAGGSAAGAGGTPPTGGAGGTSAGGSGTGAGGPGPGCVGLPAANGKCNLAFCYCASTNSCFSTAVANGCCSVAPECF